jgi:hypothetical protein
MILTLSYNFSLDGSYPIWLCYLPLSPFFVHIEKPSVYCGSNMVTACDSVRSRPIPLFYSTVHRRVMEFDGVSGIRITTKKPAKPQSNGPLYQTVPETV